MFRLLSLALQQARFLLITFTWQYPDGFLVVSHFLCFLGALDKLLSNSKIKIMVLDCRQFDLIVRE